MSDRISICLQASLKDADPSSRRTALKRQISGLKQDGRKLLRGMYHRELATLSHDS